MALQGKSQRLYVTEEITMGFEIWLNLILFPQSVAACDRANKEV